MPRVLIIGANGYIGNALCLSLLRSGEHTVWGVARTPEKARFLAIQEIIPILCPDPLNYGEAWYEIVSKHYIDIVVDASSAGPGVLEILQAIKILGQERLDLATKEGVKMQKLGFIYLSGIWLHGDSKIPMTDTMPIGTPSSPVQPVKILLDRPRWEQTVLKSQDVLNVLVVRPSLVYGGTAWGWNAIFHPLLNAIKNSASIAHVPLKEDATPGLVHIDDVASGIHAAIDKLHLIAGTGVYPIFDLTTSHESFKSIVDAAARAMGFSGKVEYAGPGDNLFLQALTSSNNSDAARAKQLLGWVPKRVGMLSRVNLYAMAWKATNLESPNIGKLSAWTLDYPDEPPFDGTIPVVVLKRLPAYILVKMDRTHAVTLPGLEPGVVPIVPASKGYKITIAVPQKDGFISNISRNVRRLQFPVTPAYAFTDYRSQGQTIPAVIVDITTPPTGAGLSLFSVYVALSRSSGQDTIRILRDFDEKLLMQPLDHNLAQEDERLDRMDLETKKWWDKMKVMHSV